MNLLLDTMAFLWWVTDDPQIPPSARRAIADPENEIYFSAVSAWEIAIKQKLGRLQIMKGAPLPWITRHLRKNDFRSLPIEVAHAASVFKLPDIHKDPFDRLLIIQSKRERMPLVTNDETILKYEISTVWY